jgi:hypothetical protein
VAGTAPDEVAVAATDAATDDVGTALFESPPQPAPTAQLTRHDARIPRTCMRKVYGTINDVLPRGDAYDAPVATTQGPHSSTRSLAGSPESPSPVSPKAPSPAWLTDHAQRVLGVLTELAPAKRRGERRSSVDLEWFRWLPLSAASVMMAAELALAQPEVTEHIRVIIPRDYAEDLMRVRQLRGFGENPLRIGFLWLAGPLSVDGTVRQVLQPLVTISVVATRPPVIGYGTLTHDGLPELGNLVTDPTARHELESKFEFGGGGLDGVSSTSASPALIARLTQLRAWVERALTSLGVDPRLPVVQPGENPSELLARRELALIYGVAAYVDETAQSPVPRSSHAWPNDRLGEVTSFHRLYLDDIAVGDSAADGESSKSTSTSLPLNASQRAVVEHSRRESLTVVSGAPGTGKSHTIVALTEDAIARGRSVLVAAKNDAAIDALLALMARSSGSTPVIFGSNRPLGPLAAQLANGPKQIVTSGVVQAFHDSVVSARTARDEARRQLSQSLHIEMNPGGGPPPPPLQTVTGRTRLQSLLTSSAAHRRLFAGFRRRRLLRKAQHAAGIYSAGTERADEHALRQLLAGAERWAAQQQADADGTDLAASWRTFEQAEGVERQRVAQWLRASVSSEQRWTRHSVAAVGSLATALRAGRSARRSKLAKFTDDRLTDAFPLWVGTLADIDDLLPAVPNLFDVVVIDEASAVEQRHGVAALLRARRAVIVGDPRQLRPVSFVADDATDAALNNHRVGADSVLASRLDVRRNSLFDAAASASVPLVLREHHRCDPHLIDWVARNLYDNDLVVTTRSPFTHSLDGIAHHRLQGTRNGEGAVAAEVRWIIDELRRCLRFGVPSVGVLSPFRAQVDALVAAAMTAFTPEELNTLDLRIGTVHEFQGNERDTVYCSMAIGADDGRGSWTFADDRHMLAVMLTRARRNLVLVHSADPPDTTRLSDYLRYVDEPPGPPRAPGALAPWARGVVEDLATAGIELFAHYPVGSEVIDAATTCGSTPVALLFDVHDDGPEAHIERHLMLRRAGWEVWEAFPSRWSARPAELTIEWLARLRGGSASALNQ